MRFPQPEVGLVISYSYLWSDEAEVGQVDGRKNCPCAIVLDDFNVFTWPGYDLRLVPGRNDRYHYGLLPPKLFARRVMTRLRREEIGPYSWW